MNWVVVFQVFRALVGLITIALAGLAVFAAVDLYPIALDIIDDQQLRQHSRLVLTEAGKIRAAYELDRSLSQQKDLHPVFVACVVKQVEQTTQNIREEIDRKKELLRGIKKGTPARAQMEASVSELTEEDADSILDAALRPCIIQTADSFENYAERVVFLAHTTAAIEDSRMAYNRSVGRALTKVLHEMRGERADSMDIEARYNQVAQRVARSRLAPLLGYSLKPSSVVAEFEPWMLRTRAQIDRLRKERDPVGLEVVQ